MATLKKGAANELANSQFVEDDVKIYVGELSTSMKEEQEIAADYMNKKNEEERGRTHAGYGWQPLPRNKLLQCYVPKEIKDRVQEIAKEEGLSTNDFMNILICAYLDHKDGKF